ncbi:hypothetical protein PTI45_04085 [Paenibacillus nuruki]|uniref:Uncharacterized protein n=1 Tax=Paenibacillus nuruki TaxID=1886670 RepID=A0A1E3KZB3_9BACL|nr:hypothetical protein PTI45_04085 [Paenibacillus nuruki]CAJ1316769.1 hypothetical protein AASFL403_16245 [Paenibacillus nuruki]
MFIVSHSETQFQKVILVLSIPFTWEVVKMFLEEIC